MRTLRYQGRRPRPMGHSWEPPVSAAILFHTMDSRSSATRPPVMAVSAFHALRAGDCVSTSSH